MTRAPILALAALATVGCADQAPKAGGLATDLRGVEAYLDDGRIERIGLERLAADGTWVASGRWREGSLREDWYGSSDEYELEEGEYVDGAREGEWIVADGSGATLGRGSYVGGERQGEWTWWYPEGSVRRSGRFEAGTQVGTWSWWHMGGQLEKRGNFDDRGLDQGEWVFWHENGAVAKRGHYEDGAAVGPWVEWHDNGRVAAEGVLAPEPRHAPGGVERLRSLHDDGLRHSLREGVWRLWHPNGQLAEEGPWEQGRRVGGHVFWRPDGTLDEKASGEYAAGSREGG